MYENLFRCEEVSKEWLVHTVEELRKQNKALIQTCKRLEYMINNVACEVNDIQRHIYKEKVVNSLILDYATELKIPADVKSELNRIYGKNAIPKETKEELLKIYRKDFIYGKERKED